MTRVFRHFIRDSIGVPVWLEMSLGAVSKQDLPLAPELAVLLMFIPTMPLKEESKRDVKSAQVTALHYIQTKGLYLACHGRKILAEEASKRLGINVYEHEIFSREAHNENKELGELWENELKKKYFDLYEPDTIPIDSLGKNVITLKNINKKMMERKFRPFIFGGEDGYIEWLEDGPWGEPEILKSHLKPEWEGDEGKRHIRHGIDLSNPDYRQVEDKPNTYFYTFNKFHPIQNREHYGRKISTINVITRPEIKKIIEGGDSKYLKLFDGDRARHFATWLAGNVNKVESGINPFTPGAPEPLPYPDDPELLNKWKEIIEAGLKSVKEKSFWNDDDYQKVYDKIFNCKRNGKPVPECFDQRYSDPKKRNAKNPEKLDSKYANRLNTSAIFNIGLIERQDIAKTLSPYEYHPKDLPYTDFTSTAEFDSNAVNLEDLKKDGFETVDGKDITYVAGNPKKKEMFISKGKNTYAAGEHFQLIKKGDNHWYLLKPTNKFAKGEDDYQSSPVTLPGSTLQQAGTKFEAPLFDEEKIKAIELDMNRNPQNWGDGIHKIGCLKSVYAAASKGRSFAAGILNKTPSSIEMDLCIGEAWLAMQNLMGSYKFKFGDPDKGSIINDEDDRTKKKDTSLLGLLKSRGVSDPQKHIDKFKDIVKNRKGEPPTEDDFSDYPSVYEAFLENGYHWRVANAVPLVVSAITKDIDTKYISNQQTVTKSGDTQDLMAQVGSKDIKRDRRKTSKPSRKDATVSASITSDVLANTAVVDTSLNPFKRTRRQADPGYYDTGYNNYFERTTKLLNTFKQGLPSNPEKPADSQDDLSNHYRKMLQPLQDISKLINNIQMVYRFQNSGMKQDEIIQDKRNGAVDGLCDALANEAITHLKKHTTLVGDDKTQSERFIKYLLSDFFIRDSKYKLVELAKSIKVDITKGFEEAENTIPETYINALAYRYRTMEKKASEKETPVVATPVPQKTMPPAPKVPPPASGGSDLSSFDLEDDDNSLSSFDLDEETEGMLSFAKYRKIQEMGVAVGPNAEFGIKPKDGCGFNYWGAPGKPGGVNITGEVLVKKKKKK